MTVGDFARFNELFDNARISIPGSFEVSERIALIRLKMTLTNIVCYDISIGDVDLVYVRNSNQDLDIAVDIVELDIKCELDYDYEYGLLDGSGTAKVTTDGNSMDTVLGFTSANFETHAPHASSVESCAANFEITNIEFSGDFVSNIVEVFERFIRNTIENSIEKVACDELASLGTNFVGGILQVADDTLAIYQGDLGEAYTNPLYLEQTTQFPSTLVPLDLLDTENVIGQWFNQALEEVDNLLTSIVPDPTGPTSDRDLGINVMLRDTLLDENRALVVNVEQMESDGILYQGHDRLTETTISLQQVKVLGLDTLTHFNPLDRIGHYTLQSEMTWEQLTLEFNVTVETKPSTLEDSILEDATSQGISENIKIDFTVENVDVLASLYLVIDQQALGAMELGPLLHTDKIASCFLSVLHALQLSGLHVESQSVNAPSLTGFVSPGIDRVLSSSAAAVFEMYKGVLEEALPNIFQSSIRHFVNTKVIDAYINDHTRSTCAPTPEMQGFVDFRDLLLSPDEALAKGASGAEPYGNLAYTVMDLLRENLLTVDGNGLLQLNSFLIEPLTKSQSGTSGTLRFPSDLITMNKTNFATKYIRTFVDNFQIGLTNLRLNNLDILKAPVSILEVTESANQLANELTLGPVAGRPLNITVGFFLELSRDDDDSESPLEMTTEVDVSISFDSASLSGLLLANIDANKFLQFPLQDILHPECWLATIPAPALDQNGLRLSNADFNLALSQVVLALKALNLNANVIKSTNLAGAAIADVLQLFENSNGTSLLLERMNALGAEVLESDALQRLLDNSLSDASKLCPHSPDYDEAAIATTLEEFTFPDLSILTIDSMLYACTLVAESAFIVYMESQSRKEPASTSPLSTQNAFSNSTDVYLDWTNPQGRMGPIANFAMEQLSRYLGEPSSDGKLGINELIRDRLLNGTDTMNWILEDSSFDMPGVTMSLRSLEFTGFDSFSEFELWEPIAPQTIQSRFRIHKLACVLTVDVTDLATKEWRQGLTLGFSMSDIQTTLSMFLGLDYRVLEELPLGSFLQTENVLPCLLSAIDIAEITQIDMSVGSFDDLIIFGLMSESLESILDFSTTAMAQHRTLILDTIPAIFDDTIRNLLNGLLATHLDSSSCPLVSPPMTDTQFVKFDDFFNEEVALYGDVPPWLMRIVNTEFLSLDEETGLPLINDALIKPLTQRQSGEEGTLNWPGEVFSILSESVPSLGFDSINISATDARLENLDTFVAPLHLLNPSESGLFILDNTLTLANGPDNLSIAVNGIFAANGAITMHNELEFSIGLGGMELIANILAKIDATNLFTFPLGDLTSLDCWLASLATTLLDANNTAHGEPGLSVKEIILSIPNLSIDAKCVECTSTGLFLLPDLLSLLSENGAMAVLEDRAVSLLLEVLRSNHTQQYLDQVILDSTRRCPHHSRFENQTAESEYPLPSFPPMTLYSMEGVVYAANLLFHTSAVVIAESHSTYSTEDSDPLVGQAEIDARSDANLLDLSDLSTTIGAWADEAVSQLTDFLASEIVDPLVASGTDLRINNILRSTILADDGRLVITFNGVGIGSDDSGIFLKELRIVGLDSIRSLDVFEPIASQTILNTIQWEKLGLEMVVSLSGADVAVWRRSLQDTTDILFTLELADIEASIGGLLVLDLDILGSLELGSIMNIENIFPCILSGARGSSLSQLLVNVGSLETLSVTGFQSADISSAVENTTATILQHYGDLIRDSIPGVLDTTVRVLLNQYADSYLSEITCPLVAPETVSPSSFVDFRDLLLSVDQSQLLGGSGSSQYGDLFRKAYELAQDFILEIDSAGIMSKVNDILVDPLTRSQSGKEGSVIFPGDLVNGGTRVSVGGLDARVQLRLNDARIENLDTIGSPIELFAPVDKSPHSLNNSMSIGVGDRPLILAAKLFMSLIGDGKLAPELLVSMIMSFSQFVSSETDNMQLRNELAISLDLSNATVLLEFMLKIAESNFLHFPLRDVLNLNCWLATIPAPALDSRGVRMDGIEPTAALTELAAAIAEVNLNISCIECSSPRMGELTSLLSSSQAQDDASEVVNMLLDYAKKLLGGNLLQLQIDRILNDASRRCPHSPYYEVNAADAVYEPFVTTTDDDSTSFLVLLGGVSLGLCILLAIVMLCVRCYVRHRHRRWLKTVSEEQARLLALWQDEERRKERELNEGTQSMFESSDIPKWVRWSMPFIILGNIAFFLSGHLSLGATVNIEISFAGERIVVEKFFEFSMARSTVDIWNAGGRELAILILVFSGIWPYTKQIMTLVLWFLPPSRLSASRRGSILLWLDWLAKWSMIDIFVLVVSIAAFRVSITSPNVGFLPEEFYSVDLLVIPLWGLYANMIAQLISQISSHFIIHYHRRIIDGYKARNTQPSDSTELVCDGGEQMSSNPYVSSGKVCDSDNISQKLYMHKFGRPHRAEEEKLVVQGWVNKALVISASCLVLLVLLGCLVPSFSLKVLGLVGVAVESGQGFEDANTDHTVFTVVKLLFEEARFVDSVGHWVGLGTLAVLLIFSVLIVPVIQCAALLRQWFVALTDLERTNLAIYIEILQAWQYAEVYLIAIFVASW